MGELRLLCTTFFPTMRRRTTWTIGLIISVFSCKEKFCGEIQLGNRFVVALEQERNQIIYCTSDDYCCDSGWNAVPMGLTDYGSNEKWIIARTKADKYWIIDKEFDIDLDSCMDNQNCHKVLTDHIKGNLTEEEFIKNQTELGVASK